MNKILRSLILTFLALNMSDAVSSVRTDLTDRGPEEVVSKARELAKTLPCANMTCLSYVNQQVSTAVVLDQHTILTSAHVFGPDDTEMPLIFFGSNPLDESGKGRLDDAIRLVIKPIIHPSFKLFDMRTVSSTFMKSKTDPTDRGRFYYQGQPIEDIDYQAYNNLGLNHYGRFDGVDLAILKLKTPLSVKKLQLSFPKFLDPDCAISNTYGISIGYGPMNLNRPDIGLSPVIGKDTKHHRHAISCKVSAFEQDDSCVLYGSYKGPFINGDETFMTDGSMMRTEGIPVCGDSGGPLFFKKDNDYHLGGILSLTRSFNLGSMRGHPQALMFEQAMQPLFPVWTDVRKYKDWIQANMGPVKK
jgi:hypothetical protein